MRSTIALALSLALVGLGRAQVQYVIDPESVDISLRRTWCDSQERQCPLLCSQLPGNSATTTSNDCQPEALTYSCVCENGASPNSTEYSLTLPYYVCLEWQSQCITACGQDNICSGDCRAKHPCGALNPTRVNTSTISTMPSTTATNRPTGTADFAPLDAAQTTASTNSNKPSGASSVFGLGQSCGWLILAGVFAGASLVL